MPYTFLTIRFSSSRLSKRFNLGAIRIRYVACFGLDLMPRWTDCHRCRRGLTAKWPSKATASLQGPPLVWTECLQGLIVCRLSQLPAGWAGLKADCSHDHCFVVGRRSTTGCLFNDNFNLPVATCVWANCLLAGQVLKLTALVCDHCSVVGRRSYTGCPLSHSYVPGNRSYLPTLTCFTTRDLSQRHYTCFTGL